MHIYDVPYKCISGLHIIGRDPAHILHATWNCLMVGPLPEAQKGSTHGLAEKHSPCMQHDLRMVTATHSAAALIASDVVEGAIHYDGTSVVVLPQLRQCNCKSDAKCIHHIYTWLQKSGQTKTACRPCHMNGALYPPMPAQQDLKHQT